MDPFVNDWIVNTNGNLYWSSRGKLPRYPIRSGRFPREMERRSSTLDVAGDGGVLPQRARDIAPSVWTCTLMRWRLAGRVSKQLGVRAYFVCSDADHLPFRSQSVDLVFSYSVLQHLERSIVYRFFGEVSRVLKPGGMCLVQLPNRFGVVSVLQQLRRGFREARTGTFEMRYWSRREIEEAVRGAGLSTPHVRADGFLSQNPQTSDADILPDERESHSLNL